MGDKITKSPHIRFAGFIDAWEQRKLEQISDIFDGTHQTPKYTESGIKFVSVENIATLETMKFISQEAYEKEYFKKQAEKGDILMTRIGDVGTARVIETEEPLAYYVTLALLKPKQVSSHFLAWLISSPGVQRNIWKRTLHIAFPKKINLCEINQVDLMVPSVDEQDKVGAFFKELDRLITLHQYKLELLKVTKKSMLQKMFPIDGENVPEIRFSGFTNVWEKHRLGDLGSVAMNRRIFKYETSETGDVPFYKIGTFGGEPDAYISRELFEEYKAKYPYPEIGDILISASGSIGRTVIYQGKDEYFQDSNIVWLKHDDRLDNTFLKQFYSIVKWQGLEGSTIKRLYNKNILDTEISVPTPAEQKKIGNFFGQLDNIITLHQSELDLLKDFKKSMLQQMFI
ncbi:restriction endonuclease subunit S [Clostridioides sp. ES-S-0145-01]|uniref:restriction endonuclease subunit S n=1 Tax=Clostridioides sp. ES-S-0145-01 TaxID=2770784 RepID=UPI001D0FE7C9|nr:restriction endonuclease subunit S [Clostridioides sp. ES-S-0145-01]